MKKHFYIFRHGQTIWNAEGRPQGQHSYPVPLTIQGQQQAQKLAQELTGKKIKIIISSDLLRARQTAEIVASALKVPVVEDARLREVDYGILNGLYALEREEVYPDFKKSYEDHSIPFPEGESLNDVAERLKKVIEEAAQTYGYRNIALSTHGHAITSLVESLFHYRVQRLENCSWVHLTYDAVKNVYEGVDLPPEQIVYKPALPNY